MTYAPENKKLKLQELFNRLNSQKILKKRAEILYILKGLKNLSINNEEIYAQVRTKNNLG